MRKVKHYFGQRRVKHHCGIIVDGRGLWAIPRLLRESFYREARKKFPFIFEEMETGIANWSDGYKLEHSIPNREHEIVGSVLEEILKHPAEPDHNPPVVPTVRYCDYELPRTPEMEAVYQQAIDKAIGQKD